MGAFHAKSVYLLFLNLISHLIPMPPKPHASSRPLKRQGKKKPSGKRVGKSRPEKSNNQRNRIIK